MGDTILLFLIYNIFNFGGLFWFLTWISEYCFKQKTHCAQKQFYECGFKSISELQIQVNLNFSLVCVFLILYDIEFTMLFPILFNFSQTNIIEYWIFLIFIFFIFISLTYDWQMHTLNWHN